MKLGFHNSIQGGLYRAIERALALGTETVQIFLHNPRGWSTKAIPEGEAELFRQRLARAGIGPVFAHASYLINLASQDRKLWHASVSLLRRELQMAEALGVEAVVVHPGRTKGAPEAEAIQRVKEALLRILSRSGTG